MADVINKDVIKDAISDALDEILTIKDKIETSDDIISNPDELKVDDETVAAPEDAATEPVTEPIEDTPVEDISVKTATGEVPVDEPVDGVPDDNVVDSVTETLENQVNEPQHYEFFGLSIDAEPDGDKYKLTIKSNDNPDGEVKEESVDNLELPTIFGIIEDYLNNNAANNLKGNVLDQNSDETEEVSSDDMAVDTDTDVAADNDDVTDGLADIPSNLDTDIPGDEDDEDKDKEDKDDDSSNLALASLIRKNSKEINAIFELGLMAKNTALEMVKDKILASTIKELVDKNREADKKLNEVNEELKQECANYILACKKCENYKKAVGLVSNKLVDIRDNLKNNKMSKPEGILATKICIDTIDKLLVNNSLDSILASIQYFNKMNEKKPVVANKIEKVETKQSIVSNKRTDKFVNRPVLAKKNVYNKNGIVSNVNLNRRSRMTSEIDALIQDITRIGESD